MNYRIRLNFLSKSLLTYLWFLQSYLTVFCLDDACLQRSFMHPTHGITYCYAVCAPEKTKPRQIDFCNLNCPGYYNDCVSGIQDNVNLTSNGAISATVLNIIPSIDNGHSVLTSNDYEWLVSTIITVVAVVSAVIVVGIALGCLFFYKRRRGRSPGLIPCTGRQGDKKHVHCQETGNPSEHDYQRDHHQTRYNEYRQLPTSRPTDAMYQC
jgi:hypothetical protein